MVLVSLLLIVAEQEKVVCNPNEGNIRAAATPCPVEEVVQVVVEQGGRQWSPLPEVLACSPV
jgi:hypothetical protein